MFPLTMTNYTTMLVAGAMAGAKVFFELRGKDVLMTEEHQIVSHMDNRKLYRYSYEAAVADVARTLNVKPGDVRFTWIGWNNGNDSF